MSKDPKPGSTYSPIRGDFKGKSFVSIDQVQKEDIDIIFEVADEMQEAVESKTRSFILKNHCVAELFYQPSTRTFTSFLGAANWLGAMTIPIQGMEAYSSAAKGETIEDTVKSIYQTTAADVIIMRHPENDSAEIAAKASYVPMINAGSGKKAHPTQAILDLYTIKNELGRIDDLEVTFLGDLKYGRTIKSLGRLLSLVNPKFKLNLVSPESLKMPKELVEEWKKKGVKVNETEELEEVLPKSDVLYVTRIQKEWFEAEGKLDEYEKIKTQFEVSADTMKKAKEKMIVMHPLPRVNEIKYGVDEDPRARYFRQMRNGLYTRMALLKLVLVGR